MAARAAAVLCRLRSLLAAAAWQRAGAPALVQRRTAAPAWQAAGTRDEQGAASSPCGTHAAAAHAPLESLEQLQRLQLATLLAETPELAGLAASAQHRIRLQMPPAALLFLLILLHQLLAAAHHLRCIEVFSWPALACPCPAERTRAATNLQHRRPAAPGTPWPRSACCLMRRLEAVA